MLQEIIIFASVMSFVAIRSTFYPLKIMMGFGWFGVMVYWTTNPVATIAAGSATDTIILLVFIGLGLTFLFMGISSRKPSKDIEVTKTPSGGIARIVEKVTSSKEPKKSKTLTSSSNLEYRQTVRKAARGSKKR